MSDAQLSSAPAAETTTTLDDFQALLTKEFRPKTEIGEGRRFDRGPNSGTAGAGRGHCRFRRCHEIDQRADPGD